MERKPKPPSARGELNVALNALTKERLIRSYSVAPGSVTLVEVTIDKGADEAVVLQRVREALPTAFTDTQVRTRAE